jgi:hypothetical protein
MLFLFLKTTQNWAPVAGNDYFQIYKTLQLFTSVITLNTNIFTSIKIIKNTCTHIYTDTKAIKNPKLNNTWVMIKI